MLKSKYFCSAVFAACLWLLISCFDLVVPPVAPSFYINLYKSEDFSTDNALSGINGTLRNKLRPDLGIIRQAKSSSLGSIVFDFVDESTPFKDWLPIPKEEVDNIWKEKTDYYVIVNDPEGNGYNPNYETKNLYWNKKGSSEENSCIHLRLKEQNR